MNQKHDRRIDEAFLVRAYSDSRTLARYKDAAREIGLWRSERKVFRKYLRQSYRILDLGCGSGRVTIGLYNDGFKNIGGVDLCPRMVDSAKEISRKLGLHIRFEVGSVATLPYKDASLDAAIFSFNGLMQIQFAATRQKAAKEVWRVLKRGGYFVFTTPHRDNRQSFWKLQRNCWDRGYRDPRLHEFGDVIVRAVGLRENYLHFPTIAETRRLLANSGLQLIERKNRAEICHESKAVDQFAPDCTFWVARKP